MGTLSWWVYDCLFEVAQMYAKSLGPRLTCLHKSAQGTAPVTSHFGVATT